MLTYYELDLGLNHVVRKWSEPTDPRANMLVQVPGGQTAASDRFEGPSGVLVCCEDHIIYRHMDGPQHRVPIPHRREPLGGPTRGILIVAAVMHKMKVRLEFDVWTGAELYRNWFRVLSFSSCKRRKAISSR
jgi:splicing factor 3B subunit 3